MRFSLNGFRARLAGLIGLLALLCAGAAAFYFDGAATAHVAEASARTLHAWGRSLSFAVASQLQDRQRSIEFMAGLPGLWQGALATPQTRQSLRWLQAAHSHHSWIGVADGNGRVQVATGGLLEGVDVSKRPWFSQGLQGPHTGDLHDAVLLAKALGGTSGEPLRFVDFAAPILDSQGRPRGVICAHANWAWVDEVVKKVMPGQASGQGVEVFILNRLGEVIYPQSSKTVVPRTLQGDDVRDELEWPDGRRYLAVSQVVRAAVVPDLGWRVVLRQPMEVALAPVHELHQRMVLLSGVVALLLTCTAYLLAARLSRPMEELAGAAQRIADGDTDGHFSVHSSAAEFQTLASSLEAMTSTMREQQAQLQDANQTLERRVAQRTAELSDLYDKAPVGYHLVDAQGRIEQINATELSLLGYRRDEVVARMSAADLFTDECQPQAKSRLLALSKGEVLPPQDAAMRHKDGHSVHVRLNSTAIFDADGRFVGARTAVMDVSDMKALEEELSREQAINRAIVHTSPNGLLLYTEQGHCILANDSAARMVGASVDLLLKQNFRELQSWKASGLLDAAMHALGGEPVHKLLNFTSTFGKQTDCQVTLMPLEARGQRMLLVVAKDVSALMNANRELDQLARRDALTDLHNRFAASERLRDEFVRSQRSNVAFSVLLLDVDHFKRVNDTHGHDVGDQVLQAVARQIKGSVRASDFVARFGGEEFLVILPDTDAQEAEVVAEKIRRAVDACELPGVGHVTLSAGLSEWRSDLPDEGLLVRRADEALYAAKGAGRNQVMVWGEAGSTG